MDGRSASRFAEGNQFTPSMVEYPLFHVVGEGIYTAITAIGLAANRPVAAKRLLGLRHGLVAQVAIHSCNIHATRVWIPLLHTVVWGRVEQCGMGDLVRR